MKFLECNKIDLGKEKCLGTAVHKYCDNQIEKINNCFISGKSKSICSPMVV
jgi:hypothetical protein